MLTDQKWSFVINFLLTDEIGTSLAQLSSAHTHIITKQNLHFLVEYNSFWTASIPQMEVNEDSLELICWGVYSPTINHIQTKPVIRIKSPKLNFTFWCAQPTCELTIKSLTVSILFYTSFYFDILFICSIYVGFVLLFCCIIWYIYSIITLHGY